MPVSAKTQASMLPERLRPYLHHGLDLVIKGNQADGDCPFCGKEGKFTVNCESGLWKCWVCGGGTDRGGSNAVTFLRRLFDHAHSIPFPVASREAPDGSPVDYDALASHRRLCDPDTLKAWGVCRSPIYPYAWLIPGYGPGCRLDQLYKWVSTPKGWRLLPTPGVWPEGKSHALHLARADWDDKRDKIIVTEGPWDGMALWETHREVWGSANFIAAPGATTWREEWSKMCAGKQVVLLYDSDHPRKQGTAQVCAGYEGMVRVAKQVNGLATSTQWVHWGPDGYDPDLPDGWDVRDQLSGAPGPSLLMVDRHEKLEELRERVTDVPGSFDMRTSAPSRKKGRRNGIELEECSSWHDLLGAWSGALRWRRAMSEALAVMLSVCASTRQAGNQLFLQVIGDPGSGKTTMCEGLLVSYHCHALEHFTGFHSGWKGEKDEKTGQRKNMSLIARVNNKTLVTPEADVMVSSPQFREIMAQQRRIFDGKSASTYKNSDQDQTYTGLRTPWIMAGTEKLLDTDQSQLGDRFLRIIIDKPTDNERRLILKSAAHSERKAMLETSNGTAGSIIEGKLRRAQALTGGYVDWLRANVEDKLREVDSLISEEAEEACMDLAELSAELRARPNMDERKIESHDAKELPTRLTRQFIRLAAHLAVVLNKDTVDQEVLSMVRKVALDTSSGLTLRILAWLCSRADGQKISNQDAGGVFTDRLQNWMELNEEKTLKYLLFLRKIDVMEFREFRHSNGKWALTERVHSLYLRCRSIGR